MTELVFDGYEMGSHLHVSQTDTMPDESDPEKEWTAFSRWWDRQHPNDKRGDCAFEAELRRKHGLCMHNVKRADCPNNGCRRNRK